jgi:hypothetical protein
MKTGVVLGTSEILEQRAGSTFLWGHAKAHRREPRCGNVQNPNISFVTQLRLPPDMHPVWSRELSSNAGHLADTLPELQRQLEPC